MAATPYPAYEGWGLKPNCRMAANTLSGLHGALNRRPDKRSAIRRYSFHSSSE
ncbi:hypothetical protein CKO_04261 [Citrobacter koseri ATCC BAA-895]|uniref:Uncharacterized protein n=1 Tax=Citrobacter koseri (strain ATCC BAA-895 / CDC 4225-83 / SGSC4696) TaxID=290338 RepID=A8APA6_CITK8|nr:hypothetical protein CKO_04261 [Citrobacter koseri ATCC BAA-895]